MGRSIKFLEYQILTTLSFALLVSVLAGKAYSPLIPLIMNSINLSYTEAALLTTVQFIAYAAFQIPMGYAVDKYGPRKLISIGLICVGIFSILFSMSTNLTQALITRALIGLATSTVFVPGLRSIGDWFSIKKRGLAMGIFGSAASVSISLSGLSAPFLAMNLDWRYSILILSLPSIILGLFSYKLLIDRDNVNNVNNVNNDSSDNKRNSSSDQIVKNLILSKNSLFLGLNQFFRWGMDNAFLVWLPTYLYTSKDFSLFESGIFLMASGLLGMLGNISGGYLSDKINSRLNVVLISWIGLAISFFFLVLVNSPILIVIVVFSISWFGNSHRSPMFAIIPDLFETDSTGLTTGIQNTWANFGGVLIPLMIGVLRDSTGSFDIGWISLAIFATAMIIFNIYFKRLVKL